jgi:hypothetical protein
MQVLGLLSLRLSLLLFAVVCYNFSTGKANDPVSFYGIKDSNRVNAKQFPYSGCRLYIRLVD